MTKKYIITIKEEIYMLKNIVSWINAGTEAGVALIALCKQSLMGTLGRDPFKCSGCPGHQSSIGPGFNSSHSTSFIYKITYGNIYPQHYGY